MHDIGVPSWAVWFELSLKGVWLAATVGVGAAMGRAGHDRQLWALVGLLLGPFAVPVAIRTARRAARRAPHILVEGRLGPGRRHVVVFVDPEAFDGTVAVPGYSEPSELGRVVVAAVVGRDESDKEARAGELRRAEGALRAAVAALRPAGIEADALILEGRPAQTLAAFASGHGLSTVVVPGGRRGERIAAEVRRAGLAVEVGSPSARPPDGSEGRRMSSAA